MWVHDKAYYIDLRNKYRPGKIRVTFVLESPPISGKYFYEPEGKTSEPLFSAMMKVIGNEPATKEDGLVAFSTTGFFLVNATYSPVNHIKSMKKRNEAILADLPELIQDLKHTVGNQGAKLVLVKANICRLLEKPLKSAGLNVTNNGTVVPFPSHNHQANFHKNIKKVLREAKIGAGSGQAFTA
jgi:hypothetical protein